jgi:hypothetical protein
MATRGEGSLLHFLDPPALARVVGLLGGGADDGSDRPASSAGVPPESRPASARQASWDARRAAAQALAVAARRLETDFAVVGLFGQLDATLLLVERVLGLRRSDTLYSRRSMAEPPPLHAHPAVAAAVRDDPAYPLPRDPSDARRSAQARADLAERLTAQRGAPTAFLAALFAAGEAAHERQARRLLGRRGRPASKLPTSRGKSTTSRRASKRFGGCRPGHPRRRCAPAAAPRQQCGSWGPAQPRARRTPTPPGTAAATQQQQLQRRRRRQPSARARRTT